MLVSRFVPALIAAVSLGATTPVAMGGERYSHAHRGHDVVGGNGLPSVVRGLGTFSGTISVARVKGSGLYFSVEPSRRPAVVTYRAPKARIIEVELEAPSDACSFEAGVCVIRPLN